jgi:hypothetical protein
MSMPVKLSDDLVKDAREEAKSADRSITSQIEHWARLGRNVEHVLRHEEVLALKRGAVLVRLSATLRAIVGELRHVASCGVPGELAQTLRNGRVVYQDAGGGRVERIGRDGRRAVGRFVNRQFVADEPERAARRR